MRALLAAALLPVLTLASACHHHRAPDSSMAGCSSAQQPAGAMAIDRLNGAFAITFVTESGPMSGANVTGRLNLRPRDARFVLQGDSGVEMAQVSIGQLDLATDSIGATPVGNAMESNAEAPGVGIYVVRRRGGDVTGAIARVGSGANVPGPARFDGAYFSLFLQRVVADTISGGWASSRGLGSQMGVSESRGHFCAVRLNQG